MIYLKGFYIMAICQACDQDMRLVDRCTANQTIEFEGGIAYSSIPYPSDRPDRCHDCNVAAGQAHHPGCDMERCPKCGGQLISCPCQIAELGDEPEPAAWYDEETRTIHLPWNSGGAQEVGYSCVKIDGQEDEPSGPPANVEPGDLLILILNSTPTPDRLAGLLQEGWTLVADAGDRTFAKPAGAGQGAEPAPEYDPDDLWQAWGGPEFPEDAPADEGGL
jgi:hypothetical protein